MTKAGEKSGNGFCFNDQKDKLLRLFVLFVDVAADCSFWCRIDRKMKKGLKKQK